MRYIWLIIPAILAFGCNQPTTTKTISGTPWKIHIIDNGYFGADGVKYAQFNKKHCFAVPWEQSGVSKVYVFDTNMVLIDTVRVASPNCEDAFLADLDGDSHPDLITLQELPANKICIHWDVLNPSNKVRTDTIHQGQQWMFGEVADINNDGLLDIVAGAKNQQATVSLFLQQPNQKWQTVRLTPAGWIMSIKLLDIDNDGLTDVLYSDRRETNNTGIFWLKNPGTNPDSAIWIKHEVGLLKDEPMFLNIYKTKNGLELLATGLTSGIFKLTPNPNLNAPWQQQKLFDIPEHCGKWTKDVLYANLDSDPQPELITAYNEAHNTHGIIYSKLKNGHWQHFAVAGLQGPKFDLTLAIDMDKDGDLDLLSTEENDNSDKEAGLGFVWYENPLKNTKLTI